MTWKELLDSDYTNVVVESYGYEERSIISDHFEPFSHKQTFNFHIIRADEYSMLEHPWLFLEEDESELTFEERDGKVYLDDPELWARP